MDSRLQSKIRAILFLPRGVPFCRCTAKEMEIVERLELLGNYSHSGHNHICEICRCRNIAGDHTERRWGDWYGIGANTGHYGVGWCRKHESKRSKESLHRMCLNHMRGLQISGKAESVAKELERLKKGDNAIAERTREVRTGIKLVMETLAEFQQKCIDGDITETANGTCVAASDETRMKLACSIAKTVASLAKDFAVISPENTITVEEVRTRLKLTMVTTQRFLHDAKDMQAWLRELSGIWGSVKGIE